MNSEEKCKQVTLFIEESISHNLFWKINCPSFFCLLLSYFTTLY